MPQYAYQGDYMITHWLSRRTMSCRFREPFQFASQRVPTAADIPANYVVDLLIHNYSIQHPQASIPKYPNMQPRLVWLGWSPTNPDFDTIYWTTQFAIH